MTSFFKPQKMAAMLLLIILFLLPAARMTAFEMEIGSTIRIEQKNGSIIIGRVVRKKATQAWIRTRYGLFMVQLGTIKKQSSSNRLQEKKRPLPCPLYLSTPPALASCSL